MLTIPIPPILLALLTTRTTRTTRTTLTTRTARTTRTTHTAHRRSHRAPEHAPVKQHCVAAERVPKVNADHKPRRLVKRQAEDRPHHPERRVVDGGHEATLEQQRPHAQAAEERFVRPAEL